MLRGWGHGNNSRYPLEVRERVVKLVLENTGEYGSE